MNTSRAICTLETMAIDMVGTLGGLNKANPIAPVLERQIEAINMAQDALRAMRDLATNENASHISIDRMNEIMQAEREGRLVILPVSFAEFNSKVGDDIYVIDDEEIIEATLCYFIFDQNCKVQGLAIYGCVGDEDFEEYEFSHDDLGKTVFLTREEAEKALEDEECD